ncbi:MAG: methyltransferase domain-containing protein [Pseudomonadota bacterium]
MIVPSSRFLVRKLVDYVPPNTSVLEIGAGTGVITLELIKRGATPDLLFICEYDQDFCCSLEEKFPGYPVFCADASKAHTFLKPNSIDCVVSGLPLRNFSASFKADLVASLRRVMKPGGTLIQYTYGMKSPLPMLRGERRECVLANLPPAFIWQYYFDS